MKSQAVDKSAVPQKNRIFVGMSGGVDSSVSAALLKNAGYDVTGVFIRVWQPDWIECTWREDRRDAMRAAAHIGIPFVTVDLEAEYKRGVIDYMIAEYAAGRTPNPDVMCNREVKFGAFWNWARQNGADAIATGHYAQVIPGRNGPEMHKAVDSNKDQTYFLWTLNKKDLEHVLFPVGHLQKAEVRSLAKKFGLPNAEKKDSQGLCFIGHVDIKEFLSHYLHPQPGSVLDEKGNVIGSHSGAMLFTIGERHGFTVTEKTPHDRPYFVISKNSSANTITVSNRNADDQLPQAKERTFLSSVNWTNRIPNIGEKVQVRSRYRQELQHAICTVRDQTSAEIVFDTPQDTLTPGQSLVIYSETECLGGGIIDRV